MKFPGQRKSKHYFPVEDKNPLKRRESAALVRNSYLVGIDQVLVDIEAKYHPDIFEKYHLKEGQSTLIDGQVADQIHCHLQENDLILSEFAGGTIGNTLHNFSVLSDARSILFGVMSDQVRVGSYAYRYLCNTSSKVDLNYLQPVEGSIGRCFTFISENGERSFALNIGIVNYLSEEAIVPEVIQKSTALLISSYLVRVSGNESIKAATFRAIHIAKQAGVPVVLSLGSRQIIESDPQWWQAFIQEYVSVLAMNEEEAAALTGFDDPLLAIDKSLDWVDLVLCTAGPIGLFMAGYTDKIYRRRTTHDVQSGALPEFNLYEFSRPMLKQDCKEPIRVYSHIAPYMGGPEKIRNTNGAGDGALAALLHDMAANRYHHQAVPHSPKHQAKFLTYSSFSQVCKYANRVSFEVLVQSSPRLSHGLPEREDNLEEAYWER